MKKKLAVVTPVYNRADLIRKLFSSLKRQMSEEFEWIIIDDGSNDNIAEVVEEFKLYSEFPIQFLKQENSGKCAALNHGISKCNAELVMVVDSDDYLTNDAIYNILNFWKIVKNKSDCIGIASYKQFEDGKISGKTFGSITEKATLNKLNYHEQRHGELTLTYRTDLLKKHPFFVCEGEKFSSEEIQYNELDKEGKLYLLHKTSIVIEYQENGITKNYWNIWVKNPIGTKRLLRSKYNHTIELNVIDIIIKKIKTIVQYDMLVNCSRDFSLREAPNVPLAACLYLPSRFILKKLLKYND